MQPPSAEPPWYEGIASLRENMAGLKGQVGIIHSQNDVILEKIRSICTSHDELDVRIRSLESWKDRQGGTASVFRQLLPTAISLIALACTLIMAVESAKNISKAESFTEPPGYDLVPEHSKAR